MHTINVEEVTQYGVETIPKLDAFSPANEEFAFNASRFLHRILLDETSSIIPLQWRQRH